jgi:hypothetical protein
MSWLWLPFENKFRYILSCLCPFTFTLDELSFLYTFNGFSFFLWSSDDFGVIFYVYGCGITSFDIWIEEHPKAHWMGGDQ